MNLLAREMSYYEILVIFSVTQYVPLAYFKPNHLYLLIPYPLMTLLLPSPH